MATPYFVELQRTLPFIVELQGIGSFPKFYLSTSISNPDLNSTVSLS